MGVMIQLPTIREGFQIDEESQMDSPISHLIINQCKNHSMYLGIDVMPR
jgi:hypothetical protein